MNSLNSQQTQGRMPIERLALNFGCNTKIVHEIATTNTKKLHEYALAGLRLQSLDLKKENIEIPEEQPTDSENALLLGPGYSFLKASECIAAKKALALYERLQVKRAVISEDTSFFIRAVPTLSGPLIKQSCAHGEIGLENLCYLAQRAQNFEACAVLVLAVAYEQHSLTFVTKIDGTIAESPRGDSGFGWDKIFEPKPEEQIRRFGKVRTWGEMPQEEKISLFPFRMAAVDTLRRYRA